MKRTLVIVFFLALALATAQRVRLRLPGGWVEGSMAGDVMVFKGIPYAHAERWRPSTVVAAWRGVLDAGEFGPICPQKGDITVRLGRWFGRYVPPASEDCLNLNVWAPAGKPPEKGWPVMVFIHGGSFTGGSGSEPIYDGASLARRGVIVVTINYRLGALGFLALPALAAEDPHGSTGDYGLLDQLAALSWLRGQVSGFGGDPDRITLFGESAGAMSLCDLYTSPLAKGAFARAIIESGGCNYAIPKQLAYQRAAEVAEKIGCGVNDLACWRAQPVGRLLEASATSETDFEKDPFKPVVDGYVLPEDPEKALREGKANRAPLLVGANAGEYRLDVTAQIDPRKSSWAGVAQIIREREGERADEVIAHYRERFGADARSAYYAYMTERILYCPPYRAGRWIAKNTEVYAYRFEYGSPYWPFVGSMHGMELPFVFGTRDVWPFWALFLSAGELQRTEPLQDAVQQLWTEFAKGEAQPRAGYAPLPRIGTGWVMGFDLPWGWRADDWSSRCALWGARQ